MTFLNWQYVAGVSFVFGMAAGLILAWAISSTAWRFAVTQKITESAERIAEQARIQAEIQQSERLLQDLKERCGEHIQQLAESGAPIFFAANQEEAHK
jgi:hypothetical protein